MAEKSTPSGAANTPPDADTVRRMEEAFEGTKLVSAEKIEQPKWLASVDNVKAYSDDEALSIKSWSDIVSLMGEKNYEAALADEILGDGFQLMSSDDKMRLLDVPMHILDWTFHDGDMGGFVSARVIVKVGTEDTAIQKYRIADGSTGIYKDLQAATAKLGRTHSLSVRRGFRVSEYEVEVETNNGPRMIPAKTFYLNLSA